jgi:MYXO-CTERM domain-containing protein
LCVAWSSAAWALNGYPLVVDTALGKPGIVENKIAPQKGCQLCHTSSDGATTTLKPFAHYMIAEFGFPNVGVEEDSQVVAALAKLKDAEPKLWSDMQAGIDPNTDPVFTDQAPPQPQHGCSTSPSSPGSAWYGAMALASFAAVLRRRSARRY